MCAPFRNGLKLTFRVYQPTKPTFTLLGVVEANCMREARELAAQRWAGETRLEVRI